MHIISKTVPTYSLYYMLDELKIVVYKIRIIYV